MIFFLNLCCCVFDTYGVEFSNNWEDLISSPTTLVSYSIPLHTRRILSTDTTVYPFKDCNLLKTISFSNAVNLEYIGPFAFYNSPIELLDLSACLKLTYIGMGAFKNTKSLVAAILSDSLTSIESALFAQSTIKSLIVPKNVTIIKGYTEHGGPFSGCVDLVNFTFHPDCVITTIESESFYNTGLKTVTIPKTVKSLGSPFFATSLESVYVDPANTFFKSENNAVYNMQMTTIFFVASTMTSFVLPSNVTFIGSHCFRSTMIETIALNNGLNRIGFMAFSGSSLHSIIIPPTVTIIDQRCFQSCPYLFSVIFQGSLSVLTARLFSGCSLLETFIFPSYLQTIQDRCFQGCTSLTSLIIPSTVTSIGGGAFQGIPSSAIEFESGSQLQLNGSLLYNSDFSIAISYLDDGNGEIVYINPQCQILSVSLFANKNVNVVFPTNSILTKIESWAFQYSRITSINIPNTVTLIQEGAFERCYYLTHLTLGESLVTIERYALSYSSLLISIQFPSTLATIHEYALSGCSSLESIIFSSSITPLQIYNNAFQYVKAASIVIPKNIFSIGYYAFRNSRVSSLIIEGDSYLQTIPAFSFATMTYLSSISFSNSIESIDINAFESCTNLVTLILGSGIKNISKWSFKDCSKLESVTIPDDSSLEIIFGMAFESCYKLHTFNVNSNHQFFSTEEGVLFDKLKTKIIVYLPASNRTEFLIPSTVTEISSYAFQSCHNLQYVSIPQNISSIGYNAFNDCIGLTNLSIMYPIDSISNNAFSGCTNLTCGSVKFNPMNFHLLINSGIPSVSLAQCQYYECPPATYVCSSLGLSSIFIFSIQFILASFN